jgi:hypothetical protein
MPRMDLDPDVKRADVARYFALGDGTRASAAYDELRRLIQASLVHVYLPAGWIAAGHRRFNVWLESPLVAGGQRITLEEWCERWQAGTLPAESRGGDAA